MVGPFFCTRIVGVDFCDYVRTCCVPATRTQQTPAADDECTGFLHYAMVGYDHTKRDKECGDTVEVHKVRCSHLGDASG